MNRVIPQLVVPIQGANLQSQHVWLIILVLGDKERLNPLQQMLGMAFSAYNSLADGERSKG